MTSVRAIKRPIHVPRIVVTAIVLAILIKTFAMDLVIIQGDSMSPTIAAHTVALVARCAYGIRLPISGAWVVRWAEPKPGEIVLVSPVDNSSRLVVKRVFELGPAYLKMESGILFGRGGSIKLEPASTIRFAGSPFLPSGRVFIVGDNGTQSFDSRNYGTVPIEKIQGKVLLYSGGLFGSAIKSQ